jgi:ribosomal protein L32
MKSEMDPTLKKRLDERLVAGEISPEQYQTIVNTLIASNPKPQESMPVEDAITELADCPQPRRSKKRKRREDSSQDDFGSQHSECPECGANLSPGVTYCSKCDHELHPKPLFDLNPRIVGAYLVTGLIAMKFGRAFDEGLMFGVFKIVLWPIFVLKGCSGG